MRLFFINLFPLLCLFWAGCSAEEVEPKLEFGLKSAYEEESGCKQVSRLAEQLISVHADKLRGSEYCKARILRKTNTLEIIVFTLEGLCRDNRELPKGSCGNNYSQYMTGVENGRGLKPIRVGKKTRFSVRQINIVNNEIILYGFLPQAGDANCCPSQKATRQYVIGEQTFKEVAP